MNFFLRDGIEVKASPFGRGLFCQQKLPEGAVICTITGPEIDFEDTLKLGAQESHAVQIDIGRYLLCDPPFLFTNHSCTPNCGINDQMEMFALRRIRENEELFWDYSTSMFERHWTMKCHCGAKQCRHTIRDFDLLPDELQQYYLQLDIVFPFIVRELQRKMAVGA
ncbi:MAG TPA: SET domain-containing protein-lysine N-methyltransferase [Chitinophagaceae bacterium]|jgi:hypothetical protein|nr:SET domain-containing protein-lysine N-methyltransferase [Chitinophagaceae bacterium]